MLGRSPLSPAPRLLRIESGEPGSRRPVLIDSGELFSLTDRDDRDFTPFRLMLSDDLLHERMKKNEIEIGIKYIYHNVIMFAISISNILKKNFFLQLS